MTWRALSVRPYILDLSRVDSGKLELEYFDFDLRTTVGRCRLTVSNTVLNVPMVSALETTI
jgi:hypothetical protein